MTDHPEPPEPGADYEEMREGVPPPHRCTDCGAPLSQAAPPSCPQPLGHVVAASAAPKSDAVDRLDPGWSGDPVGAMPLRPPVVSGSLTITSNVDGRFFDALAPPDPGERFTVMHRIVRPPLRHPIARWRWRRRHGRKLAIITTLYDCTIEAEGDSFLITPHPVGGDNADRIELEEQ